MAEIPVAGNTSRKVRITAFFILLLFIVFTPKIETKKSKTFGLWPSAKGESGIGDGKGQKKSDFFLEEGGRAILPCVGHAPHRSFTTMAFVRLTLNPPDPFL